jgi:hypothetical protein
MAFGSSQLYLNKLIKNKNIQRLIKHKGINSVFYNDPSKQCELNAQKFMHLDF